MKSFVIFAFILAIASGHRQRIEWGLHQLHAYVPAKGNEVVEYTIQYPYSMIHDIANTTDVLHYDLSLTNTTLEIREKQKYLVSEPGQNIDAIVTTAYYPKPRKYFFRAVEKLVKIPASADGSFVGQVVEYTMPKEMLVRHIRVEFELTDTDNALRFRILDGGLTHRFAKILIESKLSIETTVIVTLTL